MTDKHNEHLSALLDGEDVDPRVLDRILASSGQRSTLQRYQLAGSIIREDAKLGMTLDISAAVAMQVAQEPQVTETQHNAVASQGAAKQSWWRFGGKAANDGAEQAWWRPATSFAVAASVALVTVIGVTNYQLEPGQDIPSSQSQGSSPVFETSPFGGMANPVSFNSEQEAPRVPVNAIDQRRQIQSYFLDHQQQSQLNQQQQLQEDNQEELPTVPDGQP